MTKATGQRAPGKGRKTATHSATQMHLNAMRPGHHCIVCLTPKERHTFPICPKCTRF